MRVLQIWDCALVGFTLSEELNRLPGYEATLLRLHAGDYKIFYKGMEKIPWIISEYSKDIWLLQKAIEIADQFDVVHIHVTSNIAIWLREIKPQVPIVFTYHGTDIRNKPEDWKTWNSVDKLTVATEDLLEFTPKGTEYVPNPVNRDMWRRSGVYKPGTALYAKLGTHGDQTISEDTAIKLAKGRGLKLTIQNKAIEKIPYLEYPDYLSEFEYFLDVKQGAKDEVLDEWSLTALQAASMGLKVLKPDRELLEFPEAHNVRVVTQKWLKIYKEVIE